MASGVGVNPACVDAYQTLKLGKKLKYITFGLSKDYTEVVVEKTSEEPSYDKFLEELSEQECKWAVYDFEYEVDGGKRNKLCFFSWAPDDAKIKQKMLFASSKDALRRSLVGIAAEIQGTDYSEIAYETVLSKFVKL